MAHAIPNPFLGDRCVIGIAFLIQFYAIALRMGSQHLHRENGGSRYFCDSHDESLRKGLRSNLGTAERFVANQHLNVSWYKRARRQNSPAGQD